MATTNKELVAQLQAEILRLQGFRPPPAGAVDMGLGPVNAAFPNGIFPIGAIHELLSAGPENAAASGGFVAGLMAPLMAQGGVCLWVGTARKVFPPGLAAFGIEPHRILFIDLKKEKEALWTMEEALKCEGLAAVVGEIPEIGLIASRRLQLAVEQSRVTGFVLRHNPRNLNPIACVARWHVTPLASELEPSMPGLGFPRWHVELSKIRNGQPGAWQMEWQAGRFHCIPRLVTTLPVVRRRKTG